VSAVGYADDLPGSGLTIITSPWRFWDRTGDLIAMQRLGYGQRRTPPARLADPRLDLTSQLTRVLMRAMRPVGQPQ
jgi:hypothetical protein